MYFLKIGFWSKILVPKIRFFVFLNFTVLYQKIIFENEIVKFECKNTTGFRDYRIIMKKVYHLVQHFVGVTSIDEYEITHVQYLLKEKNCQQKNDHKMGLFF